MGNEVGEEGLALKDVADLGMQHPLPRIMIYSILYIENGIPGRLASTTRTTVSRDSTCWKVLVNVGTRGTDAGEWL
jgi:hypothetical protein